MKSTLQLFKAICSSILATIFINKIYSQPGTLDLTFGRHGKVVADYNRMDENGGKVYVQPDGKILLAGSTINGVSDNSKSDFVVFRYLKNGNPDSSFGNNGKVALDVSNNSDDYCNAIIQQTDNKIILGGSGDGMLALVRLKPNGNLDSSFGINGVVFRNNNYNSKIQSIVIQPDKKIVTTGMGRSAKYPLMMNVFILNRFNMNGAPDSSYGDMGEVATAFSNDQSTAFSSVLQNDGKVVAGGFCQVEGSDHVIRDYIALARYNNNGSLDNTFGINGKDSVNVNSSYAAGLSLALQQDEKIIVSHFSKVGSNNAFTLLRYNTNGKIDSSFGTNGITHTKIFSSDLNSWSFDNAFAVVVQKDDKIIQAGFTTNGNNLDFATVKYNSNGYVDSSFGNNGIATTDFGKGDDLGMSIAIQFDKKILVAGYVNNGVGYDLAIARYDSTGITECYAPEYLMVSNVKTNAVTINWGVSDAKKYSLHYKPSYTSEWTMVKDITSTHYDLTGLISSTKYSYKVQSVCAGGIKSAFATSAFITPYAGGPSYCGTKGTTTYEYIDSVNINNIKYRSGDNGGYGNFTGLSANLTAGTSVKITLKPGFSSSAYDEYWTVCIDYNQNGVFTDPGEKVVAKHGTGSVSKTFTVPLTVLNGFTRMRIIMHYHSYRNRTCGSYIEGETEDYMVNIAGGNLNGIASNNNIAVDALNRIAITPNPVMASTANLVLQTGKATPVTIRITDLSGRTLRTEFINSISEGKNTYLLSNLNLLPGTYMIVAEQNNSIIARTQFVLAR